MLWKVCSYDVLRKTTKLIKELWPVIAVNIANYLNYVSFELKLADSFWQQSLYLKRKHIRKYMLAVHFLFLALHKLNHKLGNGFYDGIQLDTKQNTYATTTYQ